MNKLLMKSQGFLTIIFLSIILGITFNFISPNGISLVYSYNNEIEISNDLFITIEESKQFYENSSVIFLDSRILSSFKNGHIKNAISFPYLEFDEHYSKLSAKLNNSSLIIIYCGGENCNSSEKLAVKLINKGYSNIKIFKDGWNQWKSAKFPIEKTK